MGAALGNGFMTVPCVAGAIGRDAGDILVFGDLSQKSRQNRGVTDIISCDFDGSDFQ